LAPVELAPVPGSQSWLTPQKVLPAERHWMHLLMAAILFKGALVVVLVMVKVPVVVVVNVREVVVSVDVVAVDVDDVSVVDVSVVVTVVGPPLR